MNWQAFWLGSYDPATERFKLTHDALNWIDIGGGGGGFSGGAVHWAATSNSFATRPNDADNRLLWVGWTSSAGRGSVNHLSLVRELQWDRTVRWPSNSSFSLSPHTAERALSVAALVFSGETRPLPSVCPHGMPSENSGGRV